MMAFMSKKMSIRSRIRLYRFLYTLNAMDFSYLRPVTLGCLIVCVLYVWSLIPKEVLRSMSTWQNALFYLVLTILSVAFLYYLYPYLRHRFIRFKIWLYRRKKRASFSLF